MRDDEAELPATAETDADADAESDFDAERDVESDAGAAAEIDIDTKGDTKGDVEGDIEDGFDLDQTGATPPPAGPRRTSRRGGILGAAMLGFHQAMYGKQETETVIDIEVSGDPPNIDLDGLDEDLDAQRRLVGPPLDQIKARRQPTRPVRPTRTARRMRRHP
ncbi:MAG TPA: hypothetical protein VIT64_09555 [Ilumatobacteraceae bacterium]